MAKESGFLLGEEWARRLPQMWKWQRNFRVSGAASFRNTKDSCAISISAKKQSAASGDSVTLPAGQYFGEVLYTTSQLTLGAGFLPIVNTSPT
jgi:hypothetical protein